MLTFLHRIIELATQMFTWEMVVLILLGFVGIELLESPYALSRFLAVAGFMVGIKIAHLIVIPLDLNPFTHGIFIIAGGLVAAACVAAAEPLVFTIIAAALSAAVTYALQAPPAAIACAAIVGAAMALLFLRAVAISLALLIGASLCVVTGSAILSGGITPMACLIEASIAQSGVYNPIFIFYLTLIGAIFGLAIIIYCLGGMARERLSFLRHYLIWRC